MIDNQGLGSIRDYPLSSGHAGLVSFRGANI